MKVSETKIKGILIIEPDIYKDNRGYFFESFNKNKYENIGIKEEFVQDNQSYSQKGTIRGLHFQIPPFEQSKLIRVIKGRILDVAVDIRLNSPTYGKFFSIELSGVNNKQLLIPAGFAHGFSTLKNDTVVHYKCTNFYSKTHERGIIYNDKYLNIDWKVEKQIVSLKDLSLPQFCELKDYFIYGQ